MIKITRPYNEKVTITNLLGADYYFEVSEVKKYLLSNSYIINHLMTSILPDYRLIIKNEVLTTDGILECDLEFMNVTKHFSFDAMDLTTMVEEVLKSKIMIMMNEIKNWIISLIDKEFDVQFVDSGTPIEAITE